MTDNKVAPESIELQTQPKPASAQAHAVDHGTQRLVDIDDTVDVEKADKAPDGVSVLGTAPAETEEAPVVVTAADKKAADKKAADKKAADKKPPGLFSNLNLKKMGDATKIVMAAFLCILAGSTIALAVIVGVDGNMLNNVHATSSAAGPGLIAAATGIHPRGEYLGGMSGMLDGGVHVELANIVHDASDGNDDVTMTFPAATEVVHMTKTLTSFISGGTSSLVYSFTNTTTLTPSAMDPTGVQSVAAMTSVLTSSVSMPNASSSGTFSASSTVVSESLSSQTCGEWGDGAGPCTRPYGSPNTAPSPESSLESAFGGLQTVALTPSASTATIVAGPIAGTDMSSCGPTATVYVTVTASDNLSPASAGSTVYGTSTTVGFATLTMTASNGGPLTTTQTVQWSNASTVPATQVVTSINGTLTTLSRANFTITMPLTTVNDSMTRTSILQSPTSPVGVSASGGEQAIPKPLGASSSGGSGVYCAVMLATLVMALI